MAKITLKHFIPAVVVSTLALSSASGDPQTKAQSTLSQKNKNPVVGQIGDKKIYYSDVVARKNQIGELQNVPLDSVFMGLVQQLVSETLIKEEAGKSKIQNDPELQERIRKVTEATKLQYFLEKEVEKRVTNEELLKLYNNFMKEFKEQDEVDAQHILVETEQEANAILKDIKNGKNFGDLAREKSKDPTSKNSEGKLGRFTKEVASQTIGEPFAEAAFILTPGNTSKVKSKFGWHVIKVNSKGKSKPPKFEQVAPQLRMIRSQQALLEYIQDLMKKKNVKIFDLNGKEVPLNKMSQASMDMPGDAKAGA